MPVAIARRLAARPKHPQNKRDYADVLASKFFTTRLWEYFSSQIKLLV